MRYWIFEQYRDGEWRQCELRPIAEDEPNALERVQFWTRIHGPGLQATLFSRPFLCSEATGEVVGE